MRIVYHHRTQAEDAQGIHIQEMVNAFRNLGHEIEVVALVGSDSQGRSKTGRHPWKWLIRIMPDWFYEVMSLAYNIIGYRRLTKSIRLRRPDLIYERYALNTYCGVWASRRFDIPLILEVNAPLYHEQKNLGKLAFKGLARISERWICSNSSWTLVVSQVLRGYLLREGVPDEKIVVVHNGINPNEFHPKISGESVRKKYDLEGKLVLGFVGWFRKWHGLELLLEIVSEAGLAEQGIALLLVGDGPAYQDLYNFMQAHSLQKSVIFTGSVTRQDVPIHIAAMDVAVQSSATEYACPMKILEYMGMGKCIVAPDQPNIAELLEDGKTGFLFKSGDKENFRSTVLKALKYPDLRRRISQNAFDQIHRRGLLWQTNAERVIALVSQTQRAT